MSEETPGTDQSKEVPRKRKGTVSYKLLLTVCMVSLIISTVASYFFFSKWSETADRNTTLLSERNALSQNYAVLKNSFDKIFNDLSVVRDENAQVITLQAADSAKRYMARIYWNKYTRQTFIDILSLPAPDSNMEYRLWASVAGEFMDDGVIRIIPEEEIQQMRQVVNADSWFVTLEAKGESTPPSFQNVFLTMKK